MKKIFTLFLLILASVTLISCENDKLDNETWMVTLINEGIVYDEIEYDNNAYLGILPQINKEGYEFLGWFYNDTKYDETYIVKEDLTLKSKFRNKNINNENKFDIFHLNDTHGAVLRKGDEIGLAGIGNYIKNKRNDNSVFITSGDMFQGQLISNDNKGSIIIDILNELNLDAFTIGNHEFDWGLEEILKYFDPSYDGVKANFPLLGANVVLKSTNERPEFIDSHTIVNKNGFNIGIIGVIGDGLEGSIAYRRVEDYKFTSAYQAVKETYELIEDDVDFVIVSTHDDSQMFNESVSKLPKVNAIFNGHSHIPYDGVINQVPYMQSGRYSERVGHMSITLDENFKLTNYNSINLYERNSSLLSDDDLEITNIINTYYNNMKHLYEDSIIEAKEALGVNELATFIARLMAESTNSVAGFQNSGGTRSTINKGQQITAADIFQIFPFDNEIIYTKIKGHHLKDMLNNSYFINYSSINYNEIVNDESYFIATNDYIYYHPLNSKIFNGTEPIFFGDMYETFYEVLLNLKDAGFKYFEINSEIIIGDN